MKTSVVLKSVLAIGVAVILPLFVFADTAENRPLPTYFYQEIFREIPSVQKLLSFFRVSNSGSLGGVGAFSSDVKSGEKNTAPDFSIEKIGIFPTEPKVGERATVIFTLKNKTPVSVPFGWNVSGPVRLIGEASVCGLVLNSFDYCDVMAEVVFDKAGFRKLVFTVDSMFESGIPQLRNSSYLDVVVLPAN